MTSVFANNGFHRRLQLARLTHGLACFNRWVAVDFEERG